MKANRLSHVIRGKFTHVRENNELVEYFPRGKVVAENVREPGTTEYDDCQLHGALHHSIRVEDKTNEVRLVPVERVILGEPIDSGLPFKEYKFHWFEDTPENRRQIIEAKKDIERAKRRRERLRKEKEAADKLNMSEAT